MQDKTAVLGNTPGVEEDERYIEKAYRTLSEDNRKKTGSIRCRAAKNPART